MIIASVLNDVTYILVHCLVLPDDGLVKGRNTWLFLVAFVNFEKRLLATSCPSVLSQGTTGLLLDGFREILFLIFFSKNLSGKFKFY